VPFLHFANAEAEIVQIGVEDKQSMQMVVLPYSHYVNPVLSLLNYNYVRVGLSG